MEHKLAILLSFFLLLEVNSSNAETAESSCQPYKFQEIMKVSMEEVLREFGLGNNQNETNPTAQDCPSDWFRILDSCFWVSPPSLKLNAENATSYCKTKLPNSRLFEPRSQLQNTLVRELIPALDGAHRNDNFWIGLNDHQHSGRFFYDSTDEPIIFTNWHPGQFQGGNGENCVVYDSREAHKTEWHDVPCSTRNDRFICEKPLKNKTEP